MGRKMQKNAPDSCVFRKKVVTLHAFSGVCLEKI